MDIKIEPVEIGLKMDVQKVYPDLEDLTVTPTANEQKFKSSKYGFDNVTVNAVESKELNIVPSAEEQIKEGLYNKVTIHGDSDLIPENIKEGTEIFGVTGIAKTADVKITDTSYLFYQNYRLPILNKLLGLCNDVTCTSYMFYNCSKLTSLVLTGFDTSKVSDMTGMFQSCGKLTSLDLSSFDTSNVIEMGSVFRYCSSLTDLNLSSWDLCKVTNIYDMFRDCSNLTNLKCFKNLGKAYDKKTNNYYLYTLNLSKSTLLTHGSLMDVINNLYDLNLTYDVANGGTLYTQTLQLGSTNLAKLTEEEIAIATNKRLDSFLERREYEIFFLYKTKNDSSRRRQTN